MKRLMGRMAAFAALLITGSAAAQSEWELVGVAAPADAFAIAGAPALEGLPDGRVAERLEGDVVAAWYAAPTRRYRHGVIGDDIEAGTLVVRTEGGRELRYVLPESEVFEDVTPRLADLDADGTVEVIAIRSSARAGAAVTVYGLSDDALVQKATTPFIGRANRWLNIAGIAPFTGGRTLQIAYVETPHIGGTLRLWSYEDGALRQLSELYGFSNHAIGAYELRLSVVGDFDSDGRVDLVLPDERRDGLKIMTYREGGWVQLGELAMSSRIEAVVHWNGAALIRLENGRLLRLERRR